MDQNTDFPDIQNFNLSPCDFNTWFLYQQPYINVPSYNVQSNDLLWSYPNNIGMDSQLNNYFTPNSRNDFNNTIMPDKHLFQNNMQHKYEVGKQNKVNESKHEINVVKENNFKVKQNTSEQSYKSKEFSDRKDTFISKQNSNQSVNNHTIRKSDGQHYKILSRKKNYELSDLEVTDAFPKLLDIETDFPPMSSNMIILTQKIAPKQDKTLDFKLALQKPKKAETVLFDEPEINTNEEDKIKKKRKRKRKKKVQVVETKDFEYVDDEFPNLDKAQNELTVSAAKYESKHNEKIVSKSESQGNDKKKLRRRQLLFILPNGMESQVRIVDAKSIKKSKTKRRIGQDRMKRPIGLLNPLDLSAPNVKRGKERLTPKVKKPSKLKKTILICRSQKREFREAIKNVSLTTDAGDTIDCKDNAITEVLTKPTDSSSSKIHSKNFREYCNHMISNNINSMISTLLKTLINFQDKLYNRDPIKAKIKRRLCFGLREVTKFVNMKKLRLIIIAPDLEKVDIQGGLDDIVTNIIKIARESSIPCVFGLNRGSLAYLCFKKFRVGAIGVFNFDGAESQVKELLKAIEDAREQYNQLKQIMESITNDVAVLSETAIHQFQTTIDDKDDLNHHNNCIYVGHSRTPSNALSEPISDIIEVNKSIFNSIFEDQNYQNLDSENIGIELNEDLEDRLVESYVENVLNCVSKLNLKD